MTLLKRKQSSNGIAASVSDGYLVLSLPQAKEPVVWRQSLEKIGSALFEVKNDSEDSFDLVLKKNKTSGEIIASFDNKDEAINALNAASNALHSKKAAKVIKTEANNNAPKNEKISEPKQSSGESQKWLVALLAAIIVIGLYFYLTTLIPDRTVGLGAQSPKTSGVSSNDPNQAGVPVSADDFLNSLQ